MGFKRRRSQIHSNNCSLTARKEAREETTYDTQVGLNLDLNAQTICTSLTDIEARVLAMPISQIKEIKDFVSQYTPWPQANWLNFNENRHYNFLVFDTETNLVRTPSPSTFCQWKTLNSMLQGLINLTFWMLTSTKNAWKRRVITYTTFSESYCPFPELCVAVYRQSQDHKNQTYQYSSHST